MTPGQTCLALLAHVLLACALCGVRGELPALLSAVCCMLSLVGLGLALDERPPRGRRP